ncbi:MAG: hypothetical protein KGH60_01595 [Candidatus Micrarchaeota archaeon]|nr:hypothetical protein [Candidatus Micrarchaeota archaeon]
MHNFNNHTPVGAGADKAQTQGTRPTNIGIRPTAADEIADEKNLNNLPREMKATKVLAALSELGYNNSHVRFTYHGSKIDNRNLRDLAIDIHKATNISYKDIVEALSRK